MFEPVRKQSLSEAVFDQLRGQIVNGQMQPGSSLPGERQLCALLRVNRSAVREALKRLEQAHLVTVQQGGATRVLDYRETASMDLLADLLIASDGNIDSRVVRSVIEMRSALAPHVAHLAALRGGDQTADELESVVRRMRSAKGDVEELQRLSLEFWNVLVSASENVAYRLAYNSLRQTYVRFLGALAPALAEEVSDLQSYSAIANAVRRGDTAAAERRARRLIARGAAQILALFRTRGAQDGVAP